MREWRSGSGGGGSGGGGSGDGGGGGRGVWAGARRGGREEII